VSPTLYRYITKPLVTYKRSPGLEYSMLKYELKKSKVKVTGRQKSQEIAAYVIFAVSED